MVQSGGHKPRHGSLAYRPRARARSQNARVSSWPSRPKLTLLGFAGYKAGMTHLMIIDDSPGSPTVNQEIAVPATIIEAPAMKVMAVRALEKTNSGLRMIGEIWTKEFDKDLMRTIRLPKKPKEAAIDEARVAEVRILAYTQPRKGGSGKKKPDIVEIGVSGPSAKEKLDYVKGLLGKEIGAKDVFASGEFVDVISVSKGHGNTGVIARTGVAKQRRKATGKVRHVGTLGPIRPHVVMYTAHQAGQYGYFKRTELNKRILKIGEDGKDVNQSGGITHYGLVRGPYVLIKGSIAGAKKRLVKFRKASRITREPKAPEIRHVSIDSKQGTR